MKNNIIALPAGRIKRNSLVWEKKQAKNPDLYVDMVESDAGHILRREARKEAYYKAIEQEQEDKDTLMQNISLYAMFSTLAALLGFGLLF